MTTVRANDGSSFVIPTGAPGTYPWVREASLISVAYRQAADLGNAERWVREYNKRRLAWDSIENGQDMQAVIEAGSWLDGPAQILAYLAKTAKDIINIPLDAASAVFDWAKWAPLLIAGAIVVVGIGLSKGSLSARVAR